MQNTWCEKEAMLAWRVWRTALRRLQSGVGERPKHGKGTSFTYTQEVMLRGDWFAFRQAQLDTKFNLTALPFVKHNWKGSFFQLPSRPTSLRIFALVLGHVESRCRNANWHAFLLPQPYVCHPPRFVFQSTWLCAEMLLTIVCAGTIRS